MNIDFSFHIFYLPIFLSKLWHSYKKLKLLPYCPAKSRMPVWSKLDLIMGIQTLWNSALRNIHKKFDFSYPGIQLLAGEYGTFKLFFSKDLDSNNITVRDIMTELITGDAMMDIHRYIIDQLFNMTIAFDYNERMSERTQYKYQIWFEITGYRLDDNNSYHNFAINMSNETMNLFTPIETIILDENVLNDLNLNKYTKKCFTFFSHLNHEWRHFKVNKNINDKEIYIFLKIEINFMFFIIIMHNIRKLFNRDKIAKKFLNKLL